MMCSVVGVNWGYDSRLGSASAKVVVGAEGGFLAGQTWSAMLA